MSRFYEHRGGTVRAVSDVDLDVRRGEHVAIVGASGSGKSTLLNLIGCLDRPTTGKLLIDDAPVERADAIEAARIRNKVVGFVFQSFHLLPRLTALENVALPLQYGDTPADVGRQIAANILQTLGLADRAHHLPSELSGGQQQRVAIARALVSRPKLLLADEPTGALDNTTSEEILELIRDAQSEYGMSLIMVTHDDRIAERADRILFMQDGRLAASG
ncbi:MAG: putative transport system ATP-binding protein [Sphingomonadales bacterium]|nr:putative transport system ATP-binding protein [Sphingomonadales bacterium]